MSRTTRLKNALRRLPDYWWLVQLIWLIALIVEILWVLWTAPSETSRYFYSGIFGSVLQVLLVVLLVVGLPMGIVLHFLKFRKIRRLLVVTGIYTVLIVVILLFIGPVVSDYFDYTVKTDDSVTLDGDLYVLSHDWLELDSLDDGRTFYLLRCEGLFKHCDEVSRYRSHKFYVSSDNHPSATLKVDGDTVSIVIGDDIEYTHEP